MRLLYYYYPTPERSGGVGYKLEGNGPIDERATVVEVSVANFNLVFEISNLNYPGIYVHVASNSHLGGL